MRRLFRLYPALIFMILISLAVLVINNYQIIWADIAAGLFYFTNYYFVYFQPAGLDPHYLLVSKILWSLSVEETLLPDFSFTFLQDLYSLNNRRLLYFLSVLLLVFLAIRMVFGCDFNRFQGDFYDHLLHYALQGRFYFIRLCFRVTYLCV